MGKGEVLGDWERTKIFTEKKDRENYSPAALHSKLGYIDKLFQSTWKITRRQVAASVDLSRTNHVKPNYFLVEQGNISCERNRTNK